MWTLFWVQIQKLYTYKMRHLHEIMGIAWGDVITGERVLSRAQPPSMKDTLSVKNHQETAIGQSQ